MTSRPIPGLPGYEIDEEGQVYSFFTSSPKGRVTKAEPTILTPQVRPGQHRPRYSYYLYPPSGPPIRRTREWLLLATYDRPPYEGEVCRILDPKKPATLDNLTWTNTHTKPLAKLLRYGMVMGPGWQISEDGDLYAGVHTIKLREGQAGWFLELWRSDSSYSQTLLTYNGPYHTSHWRKKAAEAATMYMYKRPEGIPAKEVDSYEQS